MEFETSAGTLALVNEPGYSFASADNTRRYHSELRLGAHAYKPTAVHGILLNDEPLLVLGDDGGCTGIHEHSLLLYRDAGYVAVGRHVVKLLLRPFAIAWTLQVDAATCFGVHANVERNALLSHGELAVCRFSEAGDVLWNAFGADIFSEGFSLHADYVETVDFDRQVYRFGYERGELLI